MEQCEDFKRINEIIRLLEQIKLSTIDAVQSQEQEKITNMIEVHFDRCMNALAARKATLLSEVSTKFQQQQIRAIECNAQVQQVLDTCNKLLQTGASIFDVDKKTAEHVWRGASGLSQPKIEIGKISANLPGDLLGSIKTHGSVTVHIQLANPYSDSSPNSNFNPSSEAVIPISISPDALSPNPNTCPNSNTCPNPYVIREPNAILSPNPYVAALGSNATLSPSPNRSPSRSPSPSPHIRARNDSFNSNPTPNNTVSNSHLNLLSNPNAILSHTQNPSYSDPIPASNPIPNSHPIHISNADHVSTSNAHLYASLNPNPTSNPVSNPPNSNSISYQQPASPNPNPPISDPNPIPIHDPSPFTGPTSTTSTTPSTTSGPTSIFSPAATAVSSSTSTSTISGPTPFSGPAISSTASSDTPSILNRPRRRSGILNANVFTNAYRYFTPPTTPSPTFPPSLMPSLAPLTPLTPSLAPLPSYAPLTPSLTNNNVQLNPSLSPCPTLINPGNLYSYNPFANSTPATPNTL
eukprot:Phypoly_transcript_02366.p1 GENE.Phypoly_transcript_02366~~Phypoly_transcript_02366.p1  ORF type:complete len:523 (+),score=79.60 Phypoly_transcript_02366:79-1647(+)